MMDDDGCYDDYFDKPYENYNLYFMNGFRGILDNINRNYFCIDCIDCLSCYFCKDCKNIKNSMFCFNI